MLRRRPTGRIARLPKLLRDQINVMLRDGLSYPDILKRLGSARADLNRRSLMDWRKGGHQEWLHEERRLDDLRECREFALRIVKDHEGKAVQEAGLQLAATHIYEVLTDFDPAILWEMLTDDPENYARIVRLLTHISDGGLKYERYRAQVAERKAKLEQEIAGAREGGITAETLRRIEEQIKLL